MRNKIKKAAFLTMLVTVVLSVSGLGLAKYLNVLPDIQPKPVVSSLTLLFAQVCTYLEPGEYLTVTETLFVPTLIFLLIMSRLSMLRKFS